MTDADARIIATVVHILTTSIGRLDERHAMTVRRQLRAALQGIVVLEAASSAGTCAAIEN